MALNSRILMQFVALAGVAACIFPAQTWSQVRIAGGPAPRAGTAAITLSTTSLTFGSQLVGTSSSPQIVTLTSSGSIALAITGITFAGATTADFSEADTCGNSLAVGARCTISIIFTPKEAGALSAELAVVDNASGSPQVINLTGAGQAMSAPRQPTIFTDGIVNGAGAPPAPAPVAPGSIISIYGANMASAPSGSGATASTLPLPTSLSGAQVLMNGIQAPLYYADSGQINAQVPWEVRGASSLAVEVLYNGAASNTATVALATVAPGIFVIVHAADYSLVAPSKPAVPGEYLIVFCNGLGPVSNQPATGAASQSSPISVTSATTTVTIGGTSAYVAFSGLTPTLVGVSQVNVQVPSEGSGAASVSVVVKTGAASSSAATIAIQGSSPQVPSNVTDSGGLTTLSSGGVTVPVQLTDPSTGNAIVGVKVALGLPSAQTGVAVLFVDDTSGTYPPQFITLLPPTNEAGLNRVALQSQASNLPVSVPVQTDCPSSLPANITVQPPINSIYVPPPSLAPPSIQEAMFEAELDALNKIAPALGVTLSYTDQQANFTTGADCANQIFGVLKSELASFAKIKLSMFAFETVTDLALGEAKIPIEAFFEIANADVSGLSSTLSTCPAWVTGATMRGIHLGNQFLLSVLFSGQPAVASFVAQPVTVQNTQGQPVPSSLCYVSAGTLGGEFAGTTDSTGTTVVNLQPDNYTLDISSKGYNTTSQAVTVPPPGQPVQPVLVAVTLPGSLGPLSFSPGTLAAGTVGVSYPAFSFCTPTPASTTALCGTFPATTNPTGGQPPYHFQLDSGGFLPLGMSLSLNGLLTGTPTTAGTSNFGVCAVDLAGNSVCKPVSLTIMSALPSVSLSATSLNFGTITVGATSNPQTVTVKNTGSGSLNITNVEFDGASDFFTNSVTSCPQPGTVAPGGTCNIQVVFSPTVSGTETGTFSVYDDASGSPQTITVTGVGGSSGGGTIKGQCDGYFSPPALACQPCSCTPNVNCGASPACGGATCFTSGQAPFCGN